MTIKKTVKPQEAAEPAPAAGGATIADRFKLDMPDSAAKKSASPAGKGTIVAIVAAVAALAATGILTFILYQHWEFLKTA